jgi:hypothetical protein
MGDAGGTSAQKEGNDFVTAQLPPVLLPAAARTSGVKNVGESRLNETESQTEKDGLGAQYSTWKEGAPGSYEVA